MVRSHEWALCRRKFTKMVCRNEVPKKIYWNGLSTPSYKLHLIYMLRFSPPILFISSDFSARFCKKTGNVKCRYVGKFATTMYSTKVPGVPPIPNLLCVCPYLPQSTALQKLFVFLNFRSRHFVEHLMKEICTPGSLCFDRPPSIQMR